HSVSESQNEGRNEPILSISETEGRILFAAFIDAIEDYEIYEYCIEPQPLYSANGLYCYNMLFNMHMLTKVNFLLNKKHEHSRTTTSGQKEEAESSQLNCPFFLMSFRIELAPNSTEWYTSNDKIKGQVILDSKTTVEILKIDITLRGITQVSLTRVDDKGQKFTDHVDETIVLLNKNVRLFPPADHVHADKYSLRPGTHKWDFEFEMPLSGEEEITDKNLLPPSLSDIDPEIGFTKYSLIAEIERSSILHLGMSKSSIEHPIVFLPGDNIDLEACPTYGVFNAMLSRVQTNPKSVSGLLARIVTTLAHDRAQTCQGIGSFEVSTELLLTPGLKFSFNLEAFCLKPDERVSIYGVKIELSIMPLKSLYENKIVQIYLLGKTGPDYARPFKVPSLFGDMGKPAEEAPKTEAKPVKNE
ncbi:hypothetical protein FF38_04036, partial [Lucilia cuprina]